MTRTYLYGYSTPPARLSLNQLESRPTWRNLDPEFKRRLIDLFDASNGTVGIGGGWRSSDQQEALFRSRYTPHPTPPGTYWQGQYWRLKPGMAPSTPPGRSYHETSTPAGAIAADLIGDLKLAHELGPRFGLRDLRDVNNEPWHFQPIEVPTARRDHDGAPLLTWITDPPPAPPQEDDDMANPVKYRRVYVKDGPEAHVTIRVKGYATPQERDTVTAFDDADGIPVTQAVFDALVAVYNA